MRSDERQTLADLELIPIDMLAWPVTYRYYVSTPWGYSQHDITLNAPTLMADPLAADKHGRLLWEALVAPATSWQCALWGFDVVHWRGAGVPHLVPVTGVTGRHGGAPASRDDSLQLVLMPGNGVGRQRRRWFLPGTPASWVSGGLLTREGWEGGLTLARAMVMGLMMIYPDPTSQWLMYYEGVAPFDLGNPRGVAFQYAMGVRCCHHTDRAPDLTLL